MKKLGTGMARLLSLAVHTLAAYAANAKANAESASAKANANRSPKDAPPPEGPIGGATGVRPNQERAYSLVTKSVGGTVSHVRDLDLNQLRQLYEELDPFYGLEAMTVIDPFTGQPVVQGPSVSREPGSIDLRIVFGPPGWDREAFLRSIPAWPKGPEEWLKSHAGSGEPPDGG